MNIQEQDDDMVMLKGVNFPLSSFSLFGLIGAPRSGKTTQSWVIQEQYDKVSKERYNFQRPQDILYQKYTHKFYISGTEVKHKPGWIYRDSAELESVCDMITTMSEDFNVINIAQQTLINFQQLFTSENYQKYAHLILQYIKTIEICKKLHPELREVYNDGVIAAVYKLCGLQFDGYLTRRPKIAMIIDDSTSEKYWSSIQNNFLSRFLSRKAHYGVFNVQIAVHDVTVLYGSFRQYVTCYLFFRGVNQEHMKMVFNQSLGMQSVDFDWQEFNRLYQDHSGFNVSIYDEKNKKDMSHNFIYVMRLPEHHVWYDFEKKIF